MQGAKVLIYLMGLRCSTKFWYILLEHKNQWFSKKILIKKICYRATGIFPKIILFIVYNGILDTKDVANYFCKTNREQENN